MDLLLLYRKQVDIYYESVKNIPIFLVIEDTQFIDEYSLQFLTELLNNDNEILPLNAKKLSIEKKYGDITKNFQIKEKINCYSKKPNKLLSIDQMGNDNKKNYFDLEKKQSNNSKRENDIKYVSKFERNFDNQPDKNIIQNICNIHIEGNGNKCLIF